MDLITLWRGGCRGGECSGVPGVAIEQVVAPVVLGLVGTLRHQRQRFDGGIWRLEVNEQGAQLAIQRGQRSRIDRVEFFLHGGCDCLGWFAHTDECELINAEQFSLLRWL